MAITDSWLKATTSKIQDSVTEKADRDGLSVRVSAKGKITFQLRFRLQGKQQRVDIGTYPLISLKSARDEAIRFRAELEKGHDPRIVKRTEKINNQEALTVDGLFTKWYTLYCHIKKSSAEQIKRSFEIYLLPKFGSLPPDRISADQWLVFLEELKVSTPYIAERLLVNTKQMLDWAVRRKLIDRNELSGLTAKRDLCITKTPGKRSLSDDELKMLFLALAKSRIAYKNKLFIDICLIYGCRNGELRFSKKCDFNFDAMTWVIPPENHKMGQITGKPLVRPIIPEIEVLLRECFKVSPKSEYLLTNAGANTPMSSSASLSLPYNLMQWLRRHKKYEMAHWSIHDLRKTARTNFSTLTQPHIAEIMLGHKLPGEWQTYDQHLYLQEQAECLKGWVKRLNDIESNNC